MPAINSPFLVVPGFFSPLQCEAIISDVEVKAPDLDLQGNPKKLERHCLRWEPDIAERFRGILPQVQARYGCEHRGLDKPLFQYYPENAKIPAEAPGCENAKYLRKKWVQYKDVDLVGVIWLKDYRDAVPLDPRVEVYGGKLEFPAYNFSLMPQRGTLVLYPAGPHFITVISPVLLGDLYQVKLNVAVQAVGGGRYVYDPKNHPGSWQEWFADFS